MADISAQIKELVEKMVDLHNRLSATTIPTEKVKIREQIVDIDKQISSLVYKLYDLKDEEIRVIKDK